MTFLEVSDNIQSVLEVGGLLLILVFGFCIWLGNRKLKTERAKTVSLVFVLMIFVVSGFSLFVIFASVCNARVSMKYYTLGDRNVSTSCINMLPENLKTSEAYIKTEEQLENSKNGIYDTVDVYCREKDITYEICFNYLNTKGCSIDTIADVNTHINRNTGYISTKGILKTSIKDGKTYYTINEFTLVGEDTDKKINSLSNNTTVNLVVQYDKTKESIDTYTIISADTL